MGTAPSGHGQDEPELISRARPVEGEEAYVRSTKTEHVSSAVSSPVRRRSSGLAAGSLRPVGPAAAPTVVVVATLKFLFAAHATSNIILLATSNTRTLSLLTLDFLAEGVREGAAVVTVLITLMTAGIALVARACGLNLGVRS